MEGAIHTNGKNSTFSSIGRMALKSSNGEMLDLIDLSEWLCRPNVKDLADLTGVPGCYFETLLESYLSDNAKIAVGPAYPTFSDLSIINGSKTV